MNDVDLVRNAYANMADRHEQGRAWIGRPLTLGEKILCAQIVGSMPKIIISQRFSVPAISKLIA